MNLSVVIVVLIIMAVLWVESVRENESVCMLEWKYPCLVDAAQIKSTNVESPYFCIVLDTLTCSQ